MSWRDTLGIKQGEPPTHIAQNTHKPALRGNSANSADSACRGEVTSKLMEVMADACQDLEIAPAEVAAALSPRDIEDWVTGVISNETLFAFARAFEQRRKIDQGERPKHYTERATCKHCGPVWLWFSGQVLGCPWCWNRAAGNPIPRPSPVRCGDCIHFKRTSHPHLGHCVKGEPEAPAGLVDQDPRYCGRFLPHPDKGDSGQTRPSCS